MNTILQSEWHFLLNTTQDSDLPLSKLIDKPLWSFQSIDLIKNILKLQRHSCFWTEYFGETKVYVGETKRTVGERIKKHTCTAKITNNLSAIAEHYQKSSHEPDLDNIKVLCREDKLIPHKVCEAIFIRKETSPTLNRDRKCEPSKIYNLLLKTPSSRALPPRTNG